MFYIESPANVGFSICGDLSECQWDDENTADDNLIAILNVLQKFPEIMKNDLYISGESYAGIYVPKVMLRLDKYITDNKDKGVYIPNLKGFMVGNGVTNWKYDTMPAFVEMAYWHGLYDDDLYAVLSKCDLSFFEWNADKLSDPCKAAITRFNELTAQINGYDVFGKCYPNKKTMEMYETNSDFGLAKVGGEVKAYRKYVP